MRPLATLLALVAITGTGAICNPMPAADAAATIARHHVDGPVIQVALLLDDSGSMEGLIGQARAQLWELINLLTRTTRDGQRPRIEVALYHYGDLPALESPLVPFTNNLDLVSERLFAVNGGGGTEACGLVIRKALDQLAWRRGPEALRLLVIAGNEEFNQGPVAWRSAVAAAREAGVVVHAIHCGTRDAGISGEWEAAARAGGGTFTCIDQDARATLPAPQDDELGKLNQQLNHTYWAYGAEGAQLQARQVAQDSNAAVAGSLASRATAKASSAYENSAWDVVDAVREKKLDLAQAPAAALPPELRDKSPAERAALVAAKERERSELQSRIATLAMERTVWLAAQQPQANTLGDGLRSAVAAQAAAAGFTIAP
jgi:Mg-chelatase subunit ChlD